MVETYSSVGIVMALYYFLLFSTCFDVSALIICIVLRAFVVGLSICLFYVSLW